MNLPSPTRSSGSPFNSTAETPTVASLSLLTITASAFFNGGPLVWVDSPGDFFYFLATGGGAVDGITFFATSQGGATRWVRSFIATGGTGNVTWNYVNSSQPVTGLLSSYMADVSGGGFTLTLPALPTKNETHEFVDETGNASANNLIIAGNGKQLVLPNGTTAANSLLAVNFEALTYIYNGTLWNLI